MLIDKNSKIKYLVNHIIAHFLATFLLGLALNNFDSFLLRERTLNLSKSFNVYLLVCLSKAFPKELSANFLATPSLAITFLSFPVLTPLPTFRTCLVSWSLRMGMTCLLRFYPSTRTLLSERMSTMVTSFPVSAPKLTLATRPTWTNLL